MIYVVLRFIYARFRYYSCSFFLFVVTLVPLIEWITNFFSALEYHIPCSQYDVFVCSYFCWHTEQKRTNGIFEQTCSVTRNVPFVSDKIRFRGGTRKLYRVSVTCISFAEFFSAEIFIR